MSEVKNEFKCDICPIKARYDNNPKSLVGRFWRWHISFCPGWKAYMNSLSTQDRQTLAEKYKQKKYLN